jgi:hypothetical protein
MEMKKMANWGKYGIAVAIAGTSMAGAYYYPAEFFITFTAGWLFFIPAAFVGYMAYGLWKYKIDQKNRIIVQIKPTEGMKAVARREAALAKEKESLYEEMSESKFR